MALAALARSTLDLLLPALCPRCLEATGPGLCPLCAASLPRIAHPCRRCGAPRAQAEAVCAACHDAGWPGIRSVHVDLVYAEGVTELVIASKAAGDLAAARALAQAAAAPPADTELVVPIPPMRGTPLGPSLPRVVAEGSARRVGAPLAARALRPRRTPARQHRLAASDRRSNVRDLFAATPAVHGRRVLVVDDLLTTGATARAAARALRQAGARSVAVLCVARTPVADDPAASQSSLARTRSAQ